MTLQRVAIEHVRNLRDVRLDLSPGLNILYGENASGKTSFLEAIHLLAYARSFRSHHLKHVIARDSAFLRVTGQLRQRDSGTLSLGIEYHEGQLRMRAAGRRVKKTSELAQYFPVIVLHQECQRFLSDGPRIRRKFLDWGVFHVEHDFLAVWRRYMRTLKQRNTLLQTGRGRAAVVAWDRELNDAAQALHELRRRYCDDLIPALVHSLALLMPGRDDITITYKPGWDVERNLIELLQGSLDQDQRRGFTYYGAHRADIAVRAGGVPAHEGLSRGQQKLLITALLVAQAQVHQRRSGRPCVFLADDLKAELDQAHVEQVIGLLDGLETQIILTATERELLESCCQAITRTFHVEHGCIQEVRKLMV
jgi:DNA replication and repair protein RecF